VFTITGYRMHKGIGVGKFIRSGTFTVGGYDWCVLYYPDGDDRSDAKDYVSLLVELQSKKSVVRALYDLRQGHRALVTGLLTAVVLTAVQLLQ
jgi:speckle-type POZ protein